MGSRSRGGGNAPTGDWCEISGWGLRGQLVSMPVETRSRAKRLKRGDLEHSPVEPHWSHETFQVGSEAGLPGASGALLHVLCVAGVEDLEPFGG